MNRIRAYRDIEGVSQNDVSDKLGISPQMVSAVESGRRVFAGDLAPLGYANERMTLPEMSEPLHRTRASTPVAAKKPMTNKPATKKPIAKKPAAKTARQTTR